MECFEDLRLDWSVQTKRMGLINPKMVLYVWSIEEDAGSEGRLLITVTVGEVILKTFICKSVGCYIGHGLT